MPIFESGKIAGIEYSDAGNFHHKHAGTEHMAGHITPKFNAIHLFLFMEIDDLNK